MTPRTKRGLSNKIYSEREGQTRFASTAPLGPTFLVGGPRVVEPRIARWHSGTSVILLCRPSALGSTETPGFFLLKAARTGWAPPRCSIHLDISLARPPAWRWGTAEIRNARTPSALMDDEAALVGVSGFKSKGNKSRAARRGGIRCRGGRRLDLSSIRQQAGAADQPNTCYGPEGSAMSISEHLPTSGLGLAVKATVSAVVA